MDTRVDNWWSISPTNVHRMGSTDEARTDRIWWGASAVAEEPVYPVWESVPGVSADGSSIWFPHNNVSRRRTRLMLYWEGTAPHSGS